MVPCSGRTRVAGRARVLRLAADNSLRPFQVKRGFPAALITTTVWVQHPRSHHKGATDANASSARKRTDTGVSLTQSSF